jgi:Domain of unknown function (DUF4169)
MIAPRQFRFIVSTYRTASVLRDRIRRTTAQGLVTMGDIVNLSKYRKQRQRTEQAKQAAENRVKFGRSKSDRARTRSEQDRRSQELEGKRRDDGRPDEQG